MLKLVSYRYSDDWKDSNKLLDGKGGFCSQFTGEMVMEPASWSMVYFYLIIEIIWRYFSRAMKFEAETKRSNR